MLATPQEEPCPDSPPLGPGKMQRKLVTVSRDLKVSTWPGRVPQLCVSPHVPVGLCVGGSEPYAGAPSSHVEGLGGSGPGRVP